MTLRRVPLALALLLIVVVLLGLWGARGRLAQRFALDTLAKRGVPARAVIDAIGPDGIVVHDLVLGDPARPDLTAAHAELAFGWRGLTPSVTVARLTRATLRASIARDGRITLGSLDRLRAPSDGTPDRLPDIGLALDHARLLLTTPYGRLTGTLDGKGNPAARFTGTLHLDRAALTFAGCALPLTGGDLAIGARERLGSVAGTLGAGALACRGYAARGGSARVDLTLPDPLTRADGRMTVALTAPSGAGGRVAAARLAFDGTLGPKRVKGTADVTATNATYGDWTAASASYRAGLGFDPSTATPVFGGPLTLKHVALSAAARAKLAKPTDALSSTPLGPLEAATRAALSRAAEDFDATGEVEYGLRPEVRFFSDAHLVARTGATAIERNGIDDLQVRVSGGGLPNARLSLQRGGGFVDLAATSAGTARIAATHLAFTYDPKLTKVTVSGPLLLDGPLGPGRVEALSIPTADIAIGLAPFTATPTRCLPVTARRVVEPRYTLADARFDFCPARGPALALAADGRLSGAFGAPAFAAKGVFAGTRFALATGRVSVALSGTASAPVARVLTAPLHAVAQLAGGARAVDLATFGATARQTPTGWSFAGHLDGGTVGPLPFDLARLSGDWTLRPDDTLAFDGGTATLTDPLPRPRFQPLLMHGLTLGYANGEATARAALDLATPRAPLATLSARYRPATSTGNADVQATLAFSPTLQPYMISERARGVIENVRGQATATAKLDIANATPQGTLRLDLAHFSFATAALGPVINVDGALTLSHFPALASAPATFTIGGVNPGVALAHGTARVQLVSATQLRIDRLAFPFANGMLSLAPTTINTALPERRFTLAATGLDLAAFIQQTGIHNLDATGTFDGTLPLTLANSGGRIEHGLLTARAPGGRLRYVGPVGPNLPAGARLAFDVLRSMRYSSLQVGIDGDVAGDLVSSIRFTGTNEAPLTTGKALPKLGPGVPFRFGVTIRAPFRSLLGTAASLSDATSLIQAGQASPPPTPTSTSPPPR